MIEHLDLLMFAFACIILILGYPVAFSLAGSAILFAYLGDYFNVFPMQFMRAIPQRIFGTMTNEILMAVPLFVFMGTMLEKSKVAEELLENMDKVFRKVRGGLGISVSIVGALLAASTGIVGATGGLVLAAWALPIAAIGVGVGAIANKSQTSKEEQELRAIVFNKCLENRGYEVLSKK